MIIRRHKKKIRNSEFKYISSYNFVLIVFLSTIIVFNAIFIFMKKPLFDSWSNIMFPVSSTAILLNKNTREFFGYFANNKKMYDKRQELENRVNELEQLVVNINDYQRENERLKSLLDLKMNKYNTESQAASVVGRDNSNLREFIVINKGTTSRLREGLAVISTTGLVGQVEFVSQNNSKIRLITDPKSVMSVTVTRTEDIAFLEGNEKLVSKRLCKLNFIRRESDIFVGDLVQTSGIGNNYPKGILIGKVSSIENNEILIKPTVDFDTLFEVIVICDTINTNSN